MATATARAAPAVTVRSLKTVKQSPKDEILVAQAQAGNRNAFRVLIERHQQSVTRTVAAMLGAGADTDDTVQEVFIKFYQSLNRFRGDASCSTYLTRIAINRSLDVLRRRKRTLARFVSRDDQSSTIPESVYEGPAPDALDLRMLIQQSMQALRPHHRAVVVLRLVEGYSTAEAAAILGVPTGTVLSRLSRAVRQLRETLEPVMAEEPYDP